MSFFAGIDLGKRKSHIRIITDKREVVEDLKVTNDPKEFERIFRKYKGAIEVSCEASSNAFWVADILEPLVRKVHVGDTKKIRWIAEARIKTDRLDAGILAELLRADLFPTIHIPPRRTRDLREMVRGLIRMRRLGRRCRNQVHGLLGRQGVAYQRKDMAEAKLGDFVREVELCRPARIAGESFVRMEEAADREAKYLQKQILREIRQEPEIQKVVKLLRTIPGLGFFSALLLIVELWDIRRFPDPGHLASYIGFVPSTHQSGDVSRNGRMTRQGNTLVRWILVEDAWVAARTHWFFGKLYERHKPRMGKSKAVIPVARALLNTIYRVWSEGKSYEELFEKKTLVG